MNRNILLRLNQVLILSLSIAACSPSDEDVYSFEVSEIDGIVTAVTQNGPKYSGELFEYRPILTLKDSTAAGIMTATKSGSPCLNMTGHIKKSI